MKAIELRRILKSKKPKFLMTGQGERKRVPARWRKPGGSDNKMRQKLKGYPKCVSQGYRSPREARYLHPSGLKVLVVNNADDIKKIDAKKEGVYLSSRIGKRKKVEIAKKCIELGIKVFNFKDTGKFIESVKADIEARKAAKGKKAEDKEKKKKEKEKKAAEKEKKEAKKEEKKDLAEKIDEEKEKQEEEKKKILTKKE